ncbi:MAG TPA: lipid A biosynthesis lauroyl acyltransferase [Gammaproteobacteria bacterium]|jgi:KDO2-lipid IV(A) lauroyltransferase
MAESAELSLRRFWWPTYWPTWFLLLGLRVIAILPLGAQMRLGRVLGRFVGRIRRRERRVAERNLEVCFPELAAPARAELLKLHLESLGLSFVEMAIGWFAPLATLERIVAVRGREHLNAALARGRGVILATAHFTPLEVGVAIIEGFGVHCGGMYRPQSHSMIDALILRGRSRFMREQIARDNVRAAIRHLQSNGVLLYLPDQTYLGNQSALVPFFGEPALTNIATSKLARLSGAAVLTYFFKRLPDYSGYVVDIDVLDGFPSADPIGDTRRLGAALERYIRTAPEQYLWTYKKFKYRPEPLPDLYAPQP